MVRSIWGIFGVLKLVKLFENDEFVLGYLGDFENYEVSLGYF